MAGVYSYMYDTDDYCFSDSDGTIDFVYRYKNMLIDEVYKCCECGEIYFPLFPATYQHSFGKCQDCEGK